MYEILGCYFLIKINSDKIEIAFFFVLSFVLNRAVG